MRVIIIEDEKPAAEKLLKALRKAEAEIEVAAVITSLNEAGTWFQENPEPDLVFMDIDLGDGLSFRLFDKVEINCPVIFCTAYDEYWQEAFEHNSIDYLLKPVSEEKLATALKKYARLKKHFNPQYKELLNWQQNGNVQGFRKRFLVKRGTDYISVRTEDIAYFYATHKLVCMVDQQNHKYILDQSLSEIEKQLDKNTFYRVNRKYLVQQNAIKKMRVYPKSKLQLDLDPSAAEDIVVSQENVAAFKDWMGQ